MLQKGLYLKPSSHISVIKVSPGYTCKRNRPDMLLTKFGSPLQIHLMIALTANPSVHNPGKIGRENLWQCGRTKSDKHKTLGCIGYPMTAKSNPCHRMQSITQNMMKLDRNHFINPKKSPHMYNRIRLILDNQVYLIQMLCEHKISPITLNEQEEKSWNWTTKDEYSPLDNVFTYGSGQPIDLMLDYNIE